MLFRIWKLHQKVHWLQFFTVWAKILPEYIIGFKRIVIQNIYYWSFNKSQKFFFDPFIFSRLQLNPFFLSLLSYLWLTCHGTWRVILRPWMHLQIMIFSRRKSQRNRGSLQCGPEQPTIGTQALSHIYICLRISYYCLLICLFCTTLFCFCTLLCIFTH